MSAHGRVDTLELKSALSALEILHELLQRVPFFSGNAAGDQYGVLGVGHVAFELGVLLP